MVTLAVHRHTLNCPPRKSPKAHHYGHHNLDQKEVPLSLDEPICLDE
jgi:hypothetical protein